MNSVRRDVYWVAGKLYAQLIKDDRIISFSYMRVSNIISLNVRRPIYETLESMISE